MISKRNNKVANLKMMAIFKIINVKLSNFLLKSLDWNEDQN